MSLRSSFGHGGTAGASPLRRSLVNVATDVIHPFWDDSDAEQRKEIEQFGDPEARVYEAKPPVDFQKPNNSSTDTISELAVKALKFCHVSPVREPKDGANPTTPHPAAYNGLMKSFSRVGKVDEVLRLFHQMKQGLCPPNVLCYNTVLNCLAIGKRFHEFREVWEEMCSSGVIPNVSTYNILVKAYSCHSHQFNLAFAVLDMMSSRGCDPDVITYSTLITGLSRAGRVEDIKTVISMMQVRNCDPNFYTSVPILKFHCDRGDLKTAETVIEMMQASSNCLQNSLVNNVWVDALCKSGRFDEAELMFKEGTSQGWKPSAISYNAYINALCKAGKADGAYRAFELMMGNGLYPTAVTVNILIYSLCLASKVFESKKVLDLGFHLGQEVSVVGYNIVMNTLCKIGLWQRVMMLLLDMLKKGLCPNTRTYNIVVHSLCEAKKLMKAEYLVNCKVFAADAVTYNTLLNGYWKMGNISKVNKLYHRMIVIEKIDLDIFTYTLLIGILCKIGKIKEAIDIFGEAETRGFLLDLVAYSALIDGCLKNNLLDEGLQLLVRMLEQGLVPNVTTQESFVRACCKENPSHAWISVKDLLGRGNMHHCCQGDEAWR